MQSPVKPSGSPRINGQPADQAAAAAPSSSQHGPEAEKKQLGEEPGPSRDPHSRWKLVALGISLNMAILLVSLDGTILATAIPSITNEFGSLGDVAWYGSSYMFAACALQLMFGKLYMLYSVKPVFLAAVVLFELGSLIAATAPSSAALVVGRAVSGLGAAGIFGGGIIVVAAFVPLRQRPICVGLLSSMHGVASVAGPLLGGVFTDRATWRWCFWINLPLGAITVLFLSFIKPIGPSSRPSMSWKKQIKQFDLPGTLVLIPSVICLLLALQWGGSKYAWRDVRIILLLVLFSLLAVVFCGIQAWQGDQATLPLRILSNRNMLGGVWFGVCISAVLFIFSYYLPIWFQVVKGVSATQSGLMNLPSILGLAVFSIVGGGLASALGVYTPLLIACSVLCAIASGLLSTLQVGSSIGYWFGYQVLLAAGAGLGGQNVMLVAQVAVPDDDMPMATSVLTFTQLLSSAIFLAVGQNIFQNQLLRHLTARLPQLSASSIINSGTASVRNSVAPEQLPDVLQAYNDAVTETFYVAVAAATLSILGALAMDWLSLNKPAEQTVADENQGPPAA
ncbi:hypothetical protein CDD83_6737 [Cordyceps sp. RAO-2017]|nr:hypothetical protein CDD83_6737 [Cordyceps sp. RAO-2017]